MALFTTYRRIMDPKTKTDAAGWLAKAISYLICILPPVVLANITHWAATVITGKKMSLRSRIAVFLGSFGIAALVHWLCITTSSGKYEWVFIWATSMGAEQLLRFFYQEFGEIIKAWMKNQLAFVLRVKDITEEGKP